jgi:hypothetical protein
MKTLRVGGWLLAALLVGCATQPKAAKVNLGAIDWKSRIGVYTYDQAVAELGRPHVEGESGDGRLAEWVVRRSPRVSFGFGMGSGSYGRHTGFGVGVGTTVSPPPHGETLRLKFGPDGRLKEWTKVKF